MSAVRLARAVTGRDLVLKFSGCYHGHADSFLVAAGSGLATLGIPGSPGVPADLAKATITATYNDLESVEALFRKYPGKIAVIAVEPVAANMGVVLPRPGFLEGLRKIADREGALLLFDEVITGFRLARGGAQELFGIKPDLTCLGKILGGGLPVGAYGGRADLMAHVAPDGPSTRRGRSPGTRSRWRRASRCSTRSPPPRTRSSRRPRRSSRRGCGRSRRSSASERLTLNRVGSILTLFFNPGPIADFDDVKKSDGAAFNRWFHGLLKRGVFIAPAAFEAMFVSTAHTEKDLAKTLAAHREALKEAFAEG
jgi:glutamate-1-semialdehyde 2,1-aminomutase (EC 5.4.3.8)